MKAKLTKPETPAAILARLIAASLAGSTPTQSAEVRWGGWRVVASRERSGAIDATAWPPRGKARNVVARGISACARKIAEGAA
jgi:hypothetical protein